MQQTVENDVGRVSVFDPMEEVLAAIGAGETVVVVDDERRENEGDLICAAEHAGPAAIQRMATQGRGLICLALDYVRVKQLGLSRMARRGRTDEYDTAFLESVDAAERITTGISAEDRSATIQACIDPDANSDSVRVPGHVFPLAAVDGGVLVRPGHTEAAVDLARLAGCMPAGVICEVLKEDGSMARLPDLLDYARREGLKITSVADLIIYRQNTETLIQEVESIGLPTRHGEFVMKLYTHTLNGQSHLALVKGDPAGQASPLVRVHSECFTGDILGSLRCDCGDQLAESLRAIEQEGHGVVLYMRQEGRGIGLPEKIKAYALQDRGLDTVEANEHLGLPADLRDYAFSAQMLRQLGISSCRLMTNNPDKISGLQLYGIEISERVAVQGAMNPHNERYLETKKQRMGHIL